MGWKLLERFGVQGVQFVLQIVLARLLAPELYGVLAIMVIFVNLATVFVQTGFNTALIQNKDVTEDDYSSVFFVSLGIAGILYTAIFLCSPFIASYYDMPEIVIPLRVLALMLFPGALNSVQLAKVSREMDFRTIFFSNVGGAIVSGVIGIAIALLGGGLWALVAQTMLSNIVVCIVMRFTSHLMLRPVCDLKRVVVLFSYGWKLLASALLDTFYHNLHSLVIGKKYDGGTLGYYNRGQQFPSFIINAINGAVQSVMLPAMSAEQDDRVRIRTMMRTSISLSAYIIFPFMAGLAAVASPLVSLLLTDKWLPCVPYMQIYCFTLAFYPIHSCNLQAINAMGRSDIFLKLEIVKKSYGLVALIIAVMCFDSPIAIAMTGAFTTVISFFVNARPNKKLIGYSYFEQVRDITPSLLLSLAMFAVVYLVGMLKVSNIILLIMQVVAGVVFYVSMSALFKPEPFTMLLGSLKEIVGKIRVARPQANDSDRI